MTGAWESMNKRVLILTGTTDVHRGSPGFVPVGDVSMEEIFNITLPSKQRYVKKHGYDLLSMRSFGKIDDTFNEFEVGFLRALRAFEMLNYYDVVMWLDADSMITNENYKIEDFQLTDDACFYVSWDWNGKYTLNTGNFILVKNKNTQDFFTKFFDIAKVVIANKISGSEQTAFNILYQNKIVPSSYYKILDHAYLNSVLSKEQLKSNWETRSPVPFPWNENSFLVHMTGLSNRARVELFNEYFNNYI